MYLLDKNMSKISFYTIGILLALAFVCIIIGFSNYILESESDTTSIIFNFVMIDLTLAGFCLVGGTIDNKGDFKRTDLLNAAMFLLSSMIFFLSFFASPYFLDYLSVNSTIISKILSVYSLIFGLSFFGLGLLLIYRKFLVMFVPNRYKKRYEIGN